MPDYPSENSPEFWAFHKAMRDATKGPWSQNLASNHGENNLTGGMFADWLSDRGDWRAELLRNLAHFPDHSYHGPVSSPLEYHRHGNPDDAAHMDRYAEQITVHHQPESGRGYTNFFGGRDPKTGEVRYVAYTTIPHPYATVTGDPLRFYSVHTPQSMAQMAETDETGDVRRAKDRIDNTAQRGTVKLARGLVERAKGLWSRLTGGKTAGPAWNHHYDGIVHVGGGLLHYAKANAERSGVAQALQKMSGNAVSSDAARIARYTELAHRFVSMFPEHQLTKHYVKTAERLNDATNAPGYQELATAVTPLVRFLNRIEARQGRDEMSHPMLPERRLPTNREAPATPVSEPAEWPLEIRKAADEGSRIPLADLRRRHTEKPVATQPADDLPPIPLVNYPGEIGATGDRWSDLDALHKGGAKRVDLVRHLIDRYALSPRNAAETLRRWATRRGVDRTKLARTRPPEPTAEQVRTVGKGDADWLAGTQLAYHLRSLVNEGLKTKDHTLTTLARRALGYRSNADDTAHGRKGAYRSDDPMQNHWLEAPPGERGGAYTGPAEYQTTTDPFLDLGRALKDRKHRLATAYNWHTLERSMMRDRAVEAAVRKLITGARDDHHLFTGVAKMFVPGATGRGPHEKQGEFFARLKKAVDASPHTLGPSNVNQLMDSLKRLADREEFRREVGEEHTSGPNSHTWQQIFGMLPGAKYMKMRRS